MVLAMVTATAKVRAVLMATPTATLMTMAAAEIEVAAAAEKLVAKEGGNYKAAAERRRQ